jgi:hypothetical protein
MDLSSETKCLIIVGTVVAVVFLINYYSSKKINSSPKALVQESAQEQNISQGFEEFASLGSSQENSSMEETVSEVSNNNNDVQQLREKFYSKNKARGGKYKRINYSEGQRDQNTNLNAIYEESNALFENGQLSNDKFTGVDDTNGQYASYKAGKGSQLSDEEIFNVNNFLPKETNKDWFEVMPEPISVKNRHLINVSRPIGVNTIGTSLRNASYDIRGSPPCPKFVVSPWLQSTIEPDYNLKGLC